MTFERAREVADAVLLEGYLLYPYRASSRKNQYRWTFGVVAPRAWSEAGGCERWWLESQCLVAGGAAARLEGRLRFLHLRRRVVEARGAGGTSPVASLEVDGRLVVAADEGVVREVGFDADLASVRPGEVRAFPFALPGGEEEETLADARGVVRGRVRKRRAALRGVLRVQVAPVPAAHPLSRLVVRVENETPWRDPTAPRDAALEASLLSTHLLLGVEGGEFLSLMDPPAWAREAAATCRSVGTYPVLAGAEGRADLVLSAPIILYDHPRIAPESHGDFFDATEIDELLTLRTRTLTDDEKRQARATDPRAAGIVDRVDRLPPEAWQRLHGAVRERRPADGGRHPWVGRKVRLRPGRARTDAQDLLYAGRIATIEKVEQDVDGTVMLAVTVDGDPAADLHRWYGRFHYYRLDEVEPVGPEEVP